ncbi:transcriptional regulator [Nonomuraea turkmeniaca]|uniref:Transcriptional regulator n=2 Tax=Nonomuraea turkmeniaca TaxID=103838 RepID=A0A5S4FN53_9ACTN|nr:helix-turn-helix domain-containing protein [Nonomuraea turkmeniaca]TMR22098.1 transcriptional regulator [Nonomuraea turkmeniaca]
MTVRKHQRGASPEREALRADVTRRYVEGESVRELALSTGRSYGTVHRLLQEAGVELRPRGGRPRPAAVHQSVRCGPWRRR